MNSKNIKRFFLFLLVIYLYAPALTICVVGMFMNPSWLPFTGIILGIIGIRERVIHFTNFILGDHNE